MTEDDFLEMEIEEDTMTLVTEEDISALDTEDDWRIAEVIKAYIQIFQRFYITKLTNYRPVKCNKVCIGYFHILKI